MIFSFNRNNFFSDGDSGHVKKRFQCPGTKLYIPLFCLCDYNVTCPGINNNQKEHYRKKTCKYGTAFISIH